MYYITSAFGKLNNNDMVKGLVVAMITGVLLFIYPLLVQHQLPQLSDVLYTAAIAGVAYLIKNVFTNAQQVTPVQ